MISTTLWKQQLHIEYLINWQAYAYSGLNQIWPWHYLRRKCTLSQNSSVIQKSDCIRLLWQKYSLNCQTNFNGMELVGQRTVFVKKSDAFLDLVVSNIHKSSRGSSSLFCFFLYLCSRSLQFDKDMQKNVYIWGR